MKRLAVLFALLCLVLLASLLSQDTDPYSVAAWERVSGYSGDVCIFPTVEDGYPEGGPLYCVNGVPYNRTTIEAGEGYELWVACHKYRSDYACKVLQEKERYD